MTSFYSGYWNFSKIVWCNLRLYSCFPRMLSRPYLVYTCDSIDHCFKLIRHKNNNNIHVERNSPKKNIHQPTSIEPPWKGRSPCKLQQKRRAITPRSQSTKLHFDCDPSSLEVQCTMCKTLGSQQPWYVVGVLTADFSYTNLQCN